MISLYRDTVRDPQNRRDRQGRLQHQPVLAVRDVASEDLRGQRLPQLHLSLRVRGGIHHEEGHLGGDLEDAHRHQYIGVRRQSEL